MVCNVEIKLRNFDQLGTNDLITDFAKINLLRSQLAGLAMHFVCLYAHT